MSTRSNLTPNALKVSHFQRSNPSEAASNPNKRDLLLLLRASGLDADVYEALIETKPTNWRRRQLFANFREAIALFLSGLDEEVRT